MDGHETFPEKRSSQEDFRAFHDSLWRFFSATRGAILVVGHGTRNRAGATQLLDLVQQMRQRAPSAVIEGCFLELAEPSIDQVIALLHQRSIDRLLVVPVLLFTAAHAKEDIPQAVSAAAIPRGIQLVGQTASLGTHASVLSLSLRRYQEVIELGQGRACPAQACARVRCDSNRCEGLGQSIGRVGLAMIGRGTSDPSALSHMRLFTELGLKDRNVSISGTGFFAGGTPTVDALLQQATRWECDTVVVQPHLLFEGDLVEQLRSKVQMMQKQHPERQWLIARTLGADPQLANVFLDMAAEQIEILRRSQS